MKLSKLALLGTFALAIASAASTYHVTVAQQAVLGSTQLKPGDYKIEVTGDKAVVKVAGKPVEADVKVENGDQKFAYTSIELDDSKHIKAIHVQGTHSTLVFSN